MIEPIEQARLLRRDQTEAEKQLWLKLRNRQLLNTKFRRQHPIPPYTLDFYCEELNLCIELDGGQHNEPERIQHDAKRTAFLEQQGIRVVRIWNDDVLANMDGTLTYIAQFIPSPGAPTARHPLPEGEGKSTRILIGEISTVHGVKGLVKLRSYVDNTDLFSATLYTDERSAKTIKLKLKNLMKDHWLAEVEGYNDRTAAESLRGTKIYIDHDSLPALADDEHYYVDLVGMECVDETGNTIGTVIDVTNFGASDLLDIKPPDGPSFYLHYTDETVLNITDKITVHIPEGLLD